MRRLSKEIVADRKQLSGRKDDNLWLVQVI